MYMEKSKVYFCKEITPASIVKIYEALGVKLNGKVAVKLHSGEKRKSELYKTRNGKKYCRTCKWNCCRVQHSL